MGLMEKPRETNLFQLDSKVKGRGHAKDPPFLALLSECKVGLGFLLPGSRNTACQIIPEMRCDNFVTLGRLLQEVTLKPTIFNRGFGLHHLPKQFFSRPQELSTSTPNRKVSQSTSNLEHIRDTF